MMNGTEVMGKQKQIRDKQHAEMRRNNNEVGKWTW